ncbi:MAG: hypothetical protein GOMPHAMPRED_005673 [Gomphillus americanus]|uniref:26S proteasome complex subunit SEM1 n=1 Tax=Gomphillus americanus TaxID=1940652 RepID=A0A8H3FSV6_9LECA|nr:MAG: hypothetical protein GOMPHAMPRED_005673 [Gomphillus americanus]
MASSSSAAETAKLQDHKPDSSTPNKDAEKQAITLEEDDEFEDFPVEDWGPEDTEVASGSAHLWEESWDDDDTSDDFSKQLKEELDKVKAGREK